MKFTFCSLTYNHEAMIIAHLESIKYQILNFGKDVEFEYILADDCSKDNTVSLVKKWLKMNGYLFSKISIAVQTKNQGTVFNYSNALRLINTDYYKIIAGDDLIYKNDILRVLMNKSKCDFIITPVLRFNETRIINSHYNSFRSVIACGDNSNKSKKFLILQYQYGVIIAAPGVFVKKSLIDEGLYKSLSNYKLIEDAAQFNYHMMQKRALFGTIPFPLILYRTDSGVSNKKPSSAYLKDISEINRTIHIKKKDSKIGSILCHYYALMLRIIKISSGMLNRDSRKMLLNFNRIINKEMIDAHSYLSEINNKAEEFMINCKA